MRLLQFLEHLQWLLEFRGHWLSFVVESWLILLEFLYFSLHLLLFFIIFSLIFKFLFSFTCEFFYKFSDFSFILGAKLRKSCCRWLRSLTTLTGCLNLSTPLLRPFFNFFCLTSWCRSFGARLVFLQRIISQLQFIDISLRLSLLQPTNLWCNSLRLLTRLLFCQRRLPRISSSLI